MAELREFPTFVHGEITSAVVDAIAKGAREKSENAHWLFVTAYPDLYGSPHVDCVFIRPKAAGCPLLNGLRCIVPGIEYESKVERYGVDVTGAIDANAAGVANST